MAGEDASLAYGVFSIPGGELAVVADGEVVVSTSFRGVVDALERLHGMERIPGMGRAEPGPMDRVAEVLRRYATGDLHALEEVEVRQPGGPFRQRAWLAMRGIRAGSVDSYAGLAARAGSPRAHRAAGTACSSNLVAPFVPCHRVVAAQGTGAHRYGIGAYGYGVAVKAALLRHEGATGVSGLSAVPDTG